MAKLKELLISVGLFICGILIIYGLSNILPSIPGSCDVCKKNVDEAKCYADIASASAAKADSAARNAEMAAEDSKASADKAEASADRAEAVMNKTILILKYKKADLLKRHYDYLIYNALNIKANSGNKIDSNDILWAILEAIQEANIEIKCAKNRKEIKDIILNKITGNHVKMAENTVSK